MVKGAPGPASYTHMLSQEKSDLLKKVEYHGLHWAKKGRSPRHHIFKPSCECNTASLVCQTMGESSPLSQMRCVAGDVTREAKSQEPRTASAAPNTNAGEEDEEDEGDDAEDGASEMR